MKKWVFTMPERDLYSKIIASADKSDIVYIIYTKRTGQVNVADFTLFTEAKCKIVFVEASPEVAEDTALAFAYGRICGENPDIILGSKNLTLSKLNESMPAAKPQRKRASKPKTADFINPPEPADQVSETPEEQPDKSPKKTRGRKKKEDTASNPEGDDFDKAYNELETYLDSLKTKSFNPASNLNGITAAVKMMNDEKVSYQEAVERVVSPSTAKKILLATEKDDIKNAIIGLSEKVIALNR